MKKRQKMKEQMDQLSYKLFNMITFNMFTNKKLQLDEKEIKRLDKFMEKSKDDNELALQMENDYQLKKILNQKSEEQ